MAVEVFERLERSRSDIEALYNATHSLKHQNDLRALEELSNAIDRIRNALCNLAISWMGLCSISEELANSINNATNYMKKIQSTSEELHSIAIVMPMVVKLLWNAYVKSTPYHQNTNVKCFQEIMNVLINFIKAFKDKLKKISNSTRTRNSQKGVESHLQCAQ
jgi:hypothetical protein